MAPKTRKQDAEASPSSSTHSMARKPCYVATYVYKGGSGKTFTVRELAATAVKEGLRVGMVDLDGQCNLTTWHVPGGQAMPFYAKDLDSDDESAEHSEDEDNCEDEEEQEEEEEEALVRPVKTKVVGNKRPADATAGNPKPVPQYPLDPRANPLSMDAYRMDNLPHNIYNAMRTAMEQPDEFFKTKWPLIEITTPDSCGAAGINEPGLWLLPGSRAVLQLEYNLESSVNFADIGSLNHWLGSFRAVLNKMTDDYNLDIIFVDCSPSAGALNKIAVMSCDYILPTAKPDSNNLSSLHGLLTAVLPSWLFYRKKYMCKLTKKIDNLSTELRAKYALPTLPPRLLPVVVLSLQAKSQVKGEQMYVYVSASQWISEIRSLYATVIQESEQPLPDDVKGLVRAPMQHHKELMKQVVKMMLPEEVVERGVTTTHHVWTLIPYVEAVLHESAVRRWPIVWSTDIEYVRFFLSDKVERTNKSAKKLRASNAKMLCRRVLLPFQGVVRWLMHQQQMLAAQS